MIYASRAGKKLEHALTHFHIRVDDLICADFGSSVGGFVDCLLHVGAKKVYAVETGYGVLAWNLRNDKRVVVMERTNAMHVGLPEEVDLITIDTSWTRLEKIIPNALSNLKKNGRIVALVKPHYEAEPRILRKGRLPDDLVPEVIERVKRNFWDLNIELLGEIESPIVGEKAKNKEYLLYLKKKDN